MTVSLSFGPKPIKLVHLGCVSHAHGTNLYAAETEEGLLAQLYGYVQQYWHNDGPGSDPDDNPPDLPADHQTAIDQYFEYMSDEWYSTDVGDLL